MDMLDGETLWFLRKKLTPWKTEEQKETKSVETQFEPLYQASAETSFDVFHYVNKYL